MIIDLSCYNTVTNWDNVAAAVDGVILRLGYRGYGKKGTLVEDKCFQKYLTALKQRNVPYGVYFVTQAINTNEALEEAFYTMDRAGKPELGIWLDSEYSTHPKREGRADVISKMLRTELANLFLQTVDNSGIYCSDSWLDTHLSLANLKTERFWIARYSQYKPKHRCDLWQNTSKHVIEGINKTVDANIVLNPELFTTKKLPSLLGTTSPTLAAALDEAGADSSFKARKEYARKLGICEYKGTKVQNELLFRLLKEKIQ